LLSISRYHIRVFFLLIFILIGTTACNLPAPDVAPALPSPLPIENDPATSTAQVTQSLIETPNLQATNPPTPTGTPTSTSTSTPTASITFTATSTSTQTLTPTEVSTATQTDTPAPSVPIAHILMQANCRYGPGTAYLYSHGLYAGDRAPVDGKNPSGTWLWIKPENLERHCWVSSSVLEIDGNISVVPQVQPRLPRTTFAGPPSNIQAVRNGDRVNVSWDPVLLSEDKRRGYLLEVTLCQNGTRLSFAVQTDNSSIEFQDEQTCSAASGGKLYTAEKHGYSDPVTIPWP
jgi:hypothetical protein